MIFTASVAIRMLVFLYGLGTVVIVVFTIALLERVRDLRRWSKDPDEEALFTVYGGYLLFVEYTTVETSALIATGVADPILVMIVGGAFRASVVRFLWAFCSALAIDWKMLWEGEPTPAERLMPDTDPVWRFVISSVLVLVMVVGSFVISPSMSIVVGMVLVGTTALLIVVLTESADRVERTEY